MSGKQDYEAALARVEEDHRNMALIQQRLDNGVIDLKTYTEARAGLLQITQQDDKDVLQAQHAMLAEADRIAANLRAESEAKKDPAQRTADELERQRLMASPLNADVFADQARQMFDAGQFERAKLLLDVAREKGISGVAVHELGLDIEAGLDVTDPKRKLAATFERDAARDAVATDKQRFDLLRTTVGLNPDGTAGDGSVPAQTIANVGFKMADYFDKKNRGETYTSSPEDGATGDSMKADPGRFAELDRANREGAARKRAIVAAGGEARA